MNERERIILIYDTYESLLTEKQRRYFEEYYFDDLSITEIALNHQVSRNAVFDQIKRTTRLLLSYESKIKLVEKTEKIETLEEEKFSKEEILKIMKE